MNESTVKYFTPAEAEKTLPLVKKIVKDILEAGFQIRTIAESTGGNIEGNEEVEKLITDIRSFMKELEEIGCFYKDWNYSMGLVDFPAIIDGREVFLCWRSDEPELMYYHGPDEGYAGRKPIPDEFKN